MLVWLSSVCGWAIDYNITICWVSVWFWVCGWAGFVLSNQVFLQYSFMIFLCLISGFALLCVLPFWDFEFLLFCLFLCSCVFKFEFVFGSGFVFVFFVFFLFLEDGGDQWMFELEINGFVGSNFWVCRSWTALDPQKWDVEVKGQNRGIKLGLCWYGWRIELSLFNFVGILLMIVLI